MSNITSVDTIQQKINNAASLLEKANKNMVKDIVVSVHYVLQACTDLQYAVQALKTSVDEITLHDGS